MSNPLTDEERTRNADRRIVLDYMVDVEAGPSADIPLGVVVAAGKWDSSDHPRDNTGRFTERGSGSSSCRSRSLR